MATILSDGKYESDIQSGTHGDRFQRDVALLTFLYMRENPGFRLGYEVKAAGKFDDIVLIDDQNEVIHFIQTKHGSVRDGNVKPIDKEALFPKRQGSGDFEITKYLASYVQVHNVFKDNKYRKKFYILTNKVYDMYTEENVEIKNTDVVELSDGKELLPFFGSKNLTFKLTRSGIGELKERVNKDILAIKEAIKDMFNTGKISETMKNYSFPLKAVLKVDKDKQCRFLDSFISENEESGNNDLYNIFKQEAYDMTQTMKVDENFLQNNSRMKIFPSYVSEEFVEEFISDFFLLLGHPHDFRPLIDKALTMWLRTWVQPDILGKVPLSDMNLAYIGLDKSFDELSKPQHDKTRSLLGTEEIRKCLDELRGAFVEVDDEELTERNELYINRRIKIVKGEKSTNRKSNIVYDTQIVEALSSGFEDQQCVVLVADPGMGKTTLLKFIAFEAQKKNDYNVFLVYFNHLVKKLNKINHITDFTVMISVLETVLSKENCNAIRIAPEQRAHAGFSFLLLMDGFDEIHSKYTTKVLDMLKLIQTKRSIRIVISSRMHTQKLLEKEFDVESMFLEPFSREDQTMYLKKSWNVPDYAEKVFKEYSYNVFENFVDTIGLYEHDICGFPLIMTMVAEIRHDHFKQYLKKVVINPEQLLNFLVDKLNMVQLYEQFIRKCFYLKCVEKSGGTFDESDLDTMIKGHIKEHQLLALKLLDIGIDENLFKNLDNVQTYESFRHRCEKESEKSHLVRVAWGDVQFAHLSYGEYFVAKYTSDNICLLNEDRVLDVFSKHKLIRKFSLIMLDGIDQNDARLDRFCEMDRGFAKWACEDGCRNIIEFLLENFKAFSQNDLAQMLWTSVNNHYVEICDLLLEHGADPNKCDEEKRTALHMATLAGNTAILDLIIKHNANVNALDKDGCTALHLAADSDWQDARIMRSLISARSNINSQGNGGQTALCIAVQNEQEEVSELLIDNNADVNTEDNYQAYLNTHNHKGLAAIHIAAYMDYVEAVQSLLDAGVSPNSCTILKRTPLHLAVMNDCIDTVELLIRHKTDVNAQNYRGCTALHYAAMDFLLECDDELENIEEFVKDPIDIVKLLLDHHANVNLLNINSESALHCAMFYDSVEIAKLLIEAGAITKARTGDDKLPFRFAVKNGCEEASELIIDLDARDNRGRTALYWAAYRNHFDLVELLLRHNADVNVVDEDGYTVLHTAAVGGGVQIIQALISAGLSPNSRTKDGRTPLHMAANNGRDEVLKYLIDIKVDVNATDNDGHTALHFASQAQTFEVVHALIKAGAITNSLTIKKRSPLHFAAERGSEEIVQLLISHNNDVNAKDDENCTPLHLAAAGYWSPRVVKLLIRYRANVNASDSNGLTALHKATQKGNHEVMQTLIEAGATINCLTIENCTPLHLATRHFTRYWWQPDTQVIGVKVLLRNIANVNASDCKGLTPLHSAAQEGNIPIIQSLIGAGAITNPRTNTGRTPLHEAVEKGHKDAAEILIHHKSEIDARDVNERTALHLAARNGHINIVESLLQHQAQVNAPDEDGCTPLHMAASSGNVQVIQALIEAGAITNPRTNYGQTLLHVAAMFGNEDAAELIIRHYNDVNAIDDKGCTALHFAARRGHTGVVKLLLQQHAELNAFDKDGCTPLQMATKEKHHQLVQLLCASGAIASETPVPLIVKEEEEEKEEDKEQKEEAKMEEKEKEIDEEKDGQKEGEEKSPKSKRRRLS